jgi:cell division protein FtsI (penicillin-binding protein 3)
MSGRPPPPRPGRGRAVPPAGSRRQAPARRPAGPPQRPAASPRRTPPPRRSAPAWRPARARRRRRRLRLGALNGRVRYGLAAVCVLLLVIGGRLVQLQGVDGSKYAGAAAAQRVERIELHALRGEIVDRDGALLAYTSNAQDITVDPMQIKAAAAEPNAGDLVGSYADKLAPLVGSTPDAVAKILTGPGQYGVLASAMSEADAQKITDLGLVGVYTQATTERQYPGGTTAANVLGFVHSDGAGGAGIEAQYNDALAGANGRITFSVDNLGNPNPASRTVTDPAHDGGTVRLSIDQALQFTSQRYLDQAVRESGARSAEMVLLDVHTGQVLAMASSGTFDAAHPSAAAVTGDTPLNPPVMSTFEPGSVQKAITFAAALQQGVIKPDTVIKVPPRITMGGVTINDAWYHPTEKFTATGVLAESSNVGTLEIARRLGPKAWDEYERRFGVGTKTGIELPAEASGYLPPRSTWSASSFANLPFGQGESMTVLQLASIYQTIANNGVRIDPRIVQSVTAAGGATTTTKQPAGVRVIKASTAQTLRTMLESVTLPGGTGTKGAIPGYRVAGKTGTAQQPDPAHGGAYSSWMNWDTFAGIVPADDPQFVAAIMVDNPAHGLEGGDVAAPLFHEIASYELAHAQIPPSGSHSKHVPLQVCDAVTRMASPSTVC